MNERVRVEENQQVNLRQVGFNDTQDRQGES